MGRVFFNGSGQSRGTVVNGATLALFGGISNKAMRSHYDFKKRASLALQPIFFHIMTYAISL